MWTVLYLDRKMSRGLDAEANAIDWAHDNSKKRVKVRIYCRRTLKSLYDPGRARIPPELANWRSIEKSCVRMKFRSKEDAVLFKMFWGDLLIPEENVEIPRPTIGDILKIFPQPNISIKFLPDPDPPGAKWTTFPILKSTYASVVAPKVLIYSGE